MRKIGYIALSLYLLLVSLTTMVANFIVPMYWMAGLAFIASLGIFLDNFSCASCHRVKEEKRD